MLKTLTFTDWNNILLNSLMRDQVVDNRIDTIVLIGGPKKVLMKAYLYAHADSTCSEEELWDSFKNIIMEEHFDPKRLIQNYSCQPLYMPQLFASIVAATADSDTAEEGNFRNRLCKVFNLKQSKIQNLSIIPKYWNALKRYLETRSIYLVLPDPKNETQIGFSKNIVLPTFSDSSNLSELFSNIGEIATEDILVYDNIPSALLSNIYRDTPRKYSDNIKEEYTKYCHNQPNLLLSIIKQIVSNLQYIPYQRRNETIHFQYLKQNGEEFIKIYSKSQVKNDPVIGLVPIAKFLSGTLVNNLSLSNSLHRQVSEEGLVAFVKRKDNQFLEYSQLLPTYGSAILFIHASVFNNLEPYFKSFVNPVQISDWIKVRIDDLCNFKDRLFNHDESVCLLEELQNISVFRLWVRGTVYLRGFYIARIKKYLFSKFYAPLVSSNQPKLPHAKSNSAGQPIDCTLQFAETNNNFFIYKFPESFRQQVVEGNQTSAPNTPVIISISKFNKKISCFNRVPDEISFMCDIKRPLQSSGLVAEGIYGCQHQLTGAECSGVNSLTYDESAIFPLRTNDAMLLQSLASQAKEIDIPAIKSTGTISDVPDEREREFYEALAVRALRKTGMSYADLCDMLQMAFSGITDYQCYLSITALIERGILERFYHPRCSFSIYFARGPQAYYIKGRGGNSHWSICGLLTMGQREYLGKLFEQTSLTASIQYYSSINSTMFMPSSMLYISASDLNIFDKIKWMNVQHTPQIPLLPDWDCLMEQFNESNVEFSGEQETAVWNPSLCMFEKAALKDNAIEKLERISLRDRYARNRVNTLYIISSGERRMMSRSRTWAIILHSLLANSSIFQSDGNDVVSKNACLMPLYFARYANLMGGLSGPFVNNGITSYFYRDFGNIFREQETDSTRYDRVTIEPRLYQRILDSDLSNHDLNKFRRRSF